jgi:Dehydrogenases with different specificities (related to short-chain alcohol dehydrogenases)
MNVVITGASRGIGFETVKALAKAGVLKIVGISRNYKQLCELKELCAQLSMTEFVPLSYDFQQITTSEPKLSGLIRQHMNHVDILINNAGALVNKPFEQISVDEINRMWTVNYLAPSLLIKNMLPLLKTGQAHVVNITSLGGFQGSMKFKGLSHYSSSKAALASLTECLAEEYKMDGLVFNALALGAVQTEMLAEAFPNYKAPVTAEQMGEFIANFALNGKSFFNGKILPVSISTP